MKKIHAWIVFIILQFTGIAAVWFLSTDRQQTQYLVWLGIVSPEETLLERIPLEEVFWGHPYIFTKLNPLVSEQLFKFCVEYMDVPFIFLFSLPIMCLPIFYSEEFYKKLFLLVLYVYTSHLLLYSYFLLMLFRNYKKRAKRV